MSIQNPYVSYSAQNLTEAQKKSVADNIGLSAYANKAATDESISAINEILTKDLFDSNTTETDVTAFYSEQSKAWQLNLRSELRTKYNNAVSSAASALNMAVELSANGTVAAIAEGTGISVSTDSEKKTTISINTSDPTSWLTGDGNVSVSTGADNKIVISCAGGSDVPSNVMISGDPMKNGQWIWADGKFVEGTSYYAHYKTYTNTPDQSISVPLSGVYFNCHNNSTATNYNYIETYAYDKNKNVKTGTLYTLPKHWTQMVTGANGISVSNTSDAKINIGFDTNSLTGSYLPLSGGKVTGIIEIEKSGWEQIRFTRTDNGDGKGGGITATPGKSEIGRSSDGRFTIKPASDENKQYNFNSDGTLEYAVSKDNRLDTHVVSYAETTSKSLAVPQQTFVVNSTGEIIDVCTSGGVMKGALFFVVSAHNG